MVRASVAAIVHGAFRLPHLARGSPFARHVAVRFADGPGVPGLDNIEMTVDDAMRACLRHPTCLGFSVHGEGRSLVDFSSHADLVSDSFISYRAETRLDGSGFAPPEATFSVHEGSAETELCVALPPQLMTSAQAFSACGRERTCAGLVLGSPSVPVRFLRRWAEPSDQLRTSYVRSTLSIPQPVGACAECPEHDFVRVFGGASESVHFALTARDYFRRGSLLGAPKGELRRMTIEEAKKACFVNRDCQGFSFHGHERGLLEVALVPHDGEMGMCHTAYLREGRPTSAVFSPQEGVLPSEDCQSRLADMPGTTAVADAAAACGRAGESCAGFIVNDSSVRFVCAWTSIRQQCWTTYVKVHQQVIGDHMRDGDSLLFAARDAHQPSVESLHQNSLQGTPNSVAEERLALIMGRANPERAAVQILDAVHRTYSVGDFSAGPNVFLAGSHAEHDAAELFVKARGAPEPVAIDIPLAARGAFGIDDVGSGTNARQDGGSAANVAADLNKKMRAMFWSGSNSQDVPSAMPAVLASGSRIAHSGKQDVTNSHAQRWGVSSQPSADVQQNERKGHDGTTAKLQMVDMILSSNDVLVETSALPALQMFPSTNERLEALAANNFVVGESVAQRDVTSTIPPTQAPSVRQSVPSALSHSQPSPVITTNVGKQIPTNAVAWEASGNAAAETREAENQEFDSHEEATLQMVAMMASGRDPHDVAAEAQAAAAKSAQEAEQAAKELAAAEARLAAIMGQQTSGDDREIAGPASILHESLSSVDKSSLASRGVQARPGRTPGTHEASCTLHSACSGLEGLCCPTAKGVFLKCCGASVSQAAVLAQQQLPQQSEVSDNPASLPATYASPGRKLAAFFN